MNRGSESLKKSNREEVQKRSIYSDQQLEIRKSGKTNLRKARDREAHPLYLTWKFRVFSMK